MRRSYPTATTSALNAVLGLSRRRSCTQTSGLTETARTDYGGAATSGRSVEQIDYEAAMLDRYAGTVYRFTGRAVIELKYFRALASVSAARAAPRIVHGGGFA